MSDKELMDAMNAAIDGAGGQAPVETADEGTDEAGAAADAATAGDEAQAGDDAQRDAAPAAGEESASAAPDDDAARAAAGDESGTRERDPATGRFRPKAADAGAAAEGADGKPAAGKPAVAVAAKPALGADGKPVKPAAAAKPPDHVNDPIPEDVKGKTRERMQGLVTQAKALTTERDTIKQELDELAGTIQATGADPETFWRHTEVLRLMLSEDQGDQLRAVKVLRGAADKIAVALGEPVPGHDPLRDPANKDLADEVESGDLSRARALELAQARSRTAATSRRTTEGEQQQQAREARAEAIDTAREDLNALGEDLKRTDGANYARKTAVLLPAVKEMVKDVRPEKWAATYRRMYEGLKLEPPAAARNGNRAPRGTGTNQPARPTQGAGGGGPAAPQNELEALDLGIAAAAQAHR